MSPLALPIVQTAIPTERPACVRPGDHCPFDLDGRCCHGRADGSTCPDEVPVAWTPTVTPLPDTFRLWADQVATAGWLAAGGEARA